METIYVPLHNNKPATFEINGHRFLVLSQDKEELEDHLSDFGGETVKKLIIDSTEDAIRQLEKKTSAKVLCSPPEIELSLFLEGLRVSLPWVQ
jgi:hypothetical protein